ncbi:LAFA_0E11188g1_1 [Lachancea sp. 'fantastica']|nr:LAFA_0E11188g1_1 [Lachancea sp. 'fantastica']
MSYPGDNTGSRPYYNSRGSSYRGRAYRGSRGGGHGPARYQYNGHSYADNNSERYGTGSNPYRGNYRNDIYDSPRTSHGSPGNGTGYVESFQRFEKRPSSSSSSHESWSSPKQPQQETRPQEPQVSENTTKVSQPIKSHLTDSPMYHLTGLDEYTIDEPERSRIRSVLREDGEIDLKLEEQKLQLCKSELELGLLSTQSEKDALNVQLTQETLDAILLMQ